MVQVRLWDLSGGSEDQCSFFGGGNRFQVASLAKGRSVASFVSSFGFDGVVPESS